MRVHICILDEDSNRYHTRQVREGAWEKFGDNKKEILAEHPGTIDPGGSICFDCTRGDDPSDLHVCDVAWGDPTHPGPNMFHTIRHSTGKWDEFQSVYVAVLSWNPDLQRRKIYQPFLFFVVGCAVTTRPLTINVPARLLNFAPVPPWAQRIGPEVPAIKPIRLLHVCGVENGSGRIWHTIREPGGAWDPFGDVGAEIKAEHPESKAPVNGFGFVTCASYRDELHVCAITFGSGLYHTVRHDDGRWEPFVEVTSQFERRPGYPLFVGMDVLKGYLQVYLTSHDGLDDWGLWHAVRDTQGFWTTLEKLPFPGTQYSNPNTQFLFPDCVVVGDTRVLLCGTNQGLITTTFDLGGNMGKWEQLSESTPGFVCGTAVED